MIKSVQLSSDRLSYISKEKDSECDLGDFGVRKYETETGRFLSTDPLWEEQRPWNVYHYSANNPIVAKDPTGLLPGDLFKTPFQAVHDFGKNYNPLSISKNAEFGTRIIEVKEGGITFYTYIVPDIGNDKGVDTRKTDDKQVAIAHTHGAYDPKTDNNVFSDADKEYAKDQKVPSYVVTPNGTIQEYNPTTGTTTLMSKDMPSDPKDPDRKNDKKPERKDERPVQWQYNGTTQETSNE